MDIPTRVEDAAEALKDTAFTFMLSDQAFAGCPCSLDHDERPTEEPIGVVLDILDPEDGERIRVGVWHDEAAAERALDEMCRRDGVRSWSVIQGQRHPFPDLVDDALEEAEIAQDAHIRRLRAAA